MTHSYKKCLLLLIPTVFSYGIIMAQTDTTLITQPQTSAFLNNWSVGLEVLANKNYLITEVGYRNDTEYKPIKGYAYGVPIRYQLWPNLALTTGIGWGQKNYQWQRTDYYEGTYTRYRNTYLQIPLGVQFTIPIVPRWPRLKVFAEGGVVAQHWLKKEMAYRLPSIVNLNNEGNDYPLNTTYDDFFPITSNGYQNEGINSKTDRQWQWQWQVAAGLQYQLSKFTFYAKVARAEDITDTQTDYQSVNRVAKYNRTYSVGAGLLVNLSIFNATTGRNNNHTSIKNEKQPVQKIGSPLRKFFTKRRPTTKAL